MERALRLCATAGVAVVGAGLIYVTPVVSPTIERRAVQLVAAEDILDLVNPLDAGLSPLTGADGSALASAADALNASGGALSAAVGDALPNPADSIDYQLLDPAFWQDFWYALLNPNVGESPWLMLTGALEQLPVIGPLMAGFGVFVVLPVSLLLAYGWSLIAEPLGLPPYGAAVEELPAAVSTAMADITPLFSDAPAMLDPGAIADFGTMLDPAAVADMGQVLTSLIP